MEYPTDVPPGWPALVSFTPNFVVPLQAYGVHTFNLSVDGQHKKTTGFIVERPRED